MQIQDHRRSLAAVIPIVLTLAGCTLSAPVTADTGSPPPETLSQFWRTQFQEVLDDPALTEFERQVLSDFEITDAEYREAQDRFVKCMADQGWEVTFRSDGGWSTGAIPGSAADRNGQSVPDQTSDRCENGSVNQIAALYQSIRANPDGLGQADLIRACFEQHGVPDGAGLSDDQFVELIEDPDFHASTPEGVVCFWDPTGSEGYTFEEAQVFDQGERERVTVSIPPSGEPVVTRVQSTSGG